MKESRDAFKLLLLATAATVALWFIPYASLLTYPFRIFITYVHETAHALGAIFTLGSVSGMRVFADGSGETFTMGGSRFVISSAGYLGSTLFGAGLLLLCHKPNIANKVLAGISLGVLAVTTIFIGFGYTTFILSMILLGMGLLWVAKPGLSKNSKVVMGSIAGGIFAILITFLALTGSLFSWIAGLLLGGALFAAAKYLRPVPARFLLSFLAVQCCLNACVDLVTLITLSASSDTHTDALNMQSLTGIPAIVWAIIWAIVSLVILAGTLWSYRRAVIRS